jgi:hypothetical protein
VADENSPAIYGWVETSKWEKSPQGTKETMEKTHDSAVPPGLECRLAVVPSAEALGYSQGKYGCNII